MDKTFISPVNPMGSNLFKKKKNRIDYIQSTSNPQSMKATLGPTNTTFQHIKCLSLHL